MDDDDGSVASSFRPALRRTAAGVSQQQQQSSGRVLQWRRRVRRRIPLTVRALGVVLLALLLWVALLCVLLSGAVVPRRTDGPPVTRAREVSPWTRAQLAAYDPAGPVDAVVLWVNGTDPAHIAAFERAMGRRPDGALARRYRDYGTLRFCVRSIEAFAPWVRRIVLVTNGQVPAWWDPHNPRGRIVTHAEIFRSALYKQKLRQQQSENGSGNSTDGSEREKGKEEGEEDMWLRDALPTFNSNAIEAHLGDIPGLAPHVLYMNDDFLLARAVPRAFFVDARSGRLRLHVSDLVAPEAAAMRTNLWHRSVAHANYLVNAHYHAGAARPHHYAGHYCYFFARAVLERVAALWPAELDATSRRRVRTANDTALPFLHLNVALEEGLGDLVRGANRGGYAVWTAAHARNVHTAQHLFAARPRLRAPYCLCLQDGLDASPFAAREIDYLRRTLCAFLPKRSSFERTDQPDPCADVPV